MWPSPNKSFSLNMLVIYIRYADLITNGCYLSCGSKTHIHIIPRKENDCLWASEVCIFLCDYFIPPWSLSWETLTRKLVNNLQSLKRLSLKLDQALHLVESIQEQILVANKQEESKNEGSDLPGISRDWSFKCNICTLIIDIP